VREREAVENQKTVIMKKVLCEAQITINWKLNLKRRREGKKETEKK